MTHPQVPNSQVMEVHENGTRVAQEAEFSPGFRTVYGLFYYRAVMFLDGVWSAYNTSIKN